VSDEKYNAPEEPPDVRIGGVSLLEFGRLAVAALTTEQLVLLGNFFLEAAAARRQY
jgi:hypothetical protein